MISLKPGVRLQGLRPELVVGLLIAGTVYQKYGYDLIITSCMEGKHKRASAHYTGRAVDLRVHNVKQEDRDVILTELRQALGFDFDVDREAIGRPREHIHLEFDPKEPLNMRL